MMVPLTVTAKLTAGFPSIQVESCACCFGTTQPEPSLHIQRKDLFHLTPTLVGKQEGQVISIATLGGHGVG